MEVVNYFGPPLVRLRADEKIVRALNLKADRLAEEKSNNVYDIKLGDLHEIENYILQTGKDFYTKFSASPDHSPKLKILSIRIQFQKKESWSYLHSERGDLSGLIFLKMPSDKTDSLPTSDPRSKFPGGITFTHGTPDTFQKAFVTLKPSAGDYFLFPSSVFHMDYPFFSEDERRGLYFNLRLER